MKMVYLEFQIHEIVLLNMPGQRHTGRGGGAPPKAGQVVPAATQVCRRWTQGGAWRGLAPRQYLFLITLEIFGDFYSIFYQGNAEGRNSPAVPASPQVKGVKGSNKHAAVLCRATGRLPPRRAPGTRSRVIFFLFGGGEGRLKAGRCRGSLT